MAALNKHECLRGITPIQDCIEGISRMPEYVFLAALDNKIGGIQCSDYGKVSIRLRDHFFPTR